MEKRTILAIVLSAAVIFGFQMLNSYLYPQKEQINTQISQDENIVVAEEEVETITGTDSTNYEVSDSNLREDIIVETNIFNITFDTKGASIKSLKLQEHNLSVYNEDKVDLVLDKIENNTFFNISLGDYRDPIYNGIYSFKDLGNYTYEFENSFIYTQGGTEYPLTMVKTYKFNPDEYMFELKVVLKNSDNTGLPLNSDGSLYALQVGKQFGPEFEKLNRREEYRKFSVYTDGKRKEQKVKKGESIFTETFSWTSIEGKFFTIAVIPDNTSSYLRYSDTPVNSIPTSDLSINRRGNSSSFIEDTYKIYAGPKDKSTLESYDEYNLKEIIDFWPVGMFFMWLLELLYKVVGNYGLAIIILTLAIKGILYPFTKKSFESMGKMQTIQPKVQELQAKYKDDPNKLNAAMADLYKREGVNPLGGCLPMLLQMPIFITFYSLLNEFIGLRGATFIPGWINDLSKPEYILQFGFELPFLGWDALRILPILYVGTQLISMKFTQNNQKKSGAAPQGSSAMQQKMLTLGMPIMFFFIMYNQTSGLLLYWTTMNIVQSLQQIFGKKKSEKALEEEVKLKQEKKKGKKRR